MENRPPDNFDDPALKSAVRRAWGNERAPDSLRKSIALMAMPGSAAPVSHSLLKYLSPSPLKSIAAAVLMTIGVAALAYQGYRMTHSGPVHGGSEKIPTPVAQKLAADHDHLITDANKWGADLPHDNAELAAALKQRLGYAPLAAPPGEGFSLVGASMVGKGNGAELLYKKGNQTVSVFSLPASEVPLCGNNATVGGAGIPNHPMAGFVHDGGFYMLVGSSTDNSISAPQVQDLRNKLRATIPGAIPH